MGDDCRLPMKVGGQRCVSRLSQPRRHGADARRAMMFSARWAEAEVGPAASPGLFGGLLTSCRTFGLPVVWRVHMLWDGIVFWLAWPAIQVWNECLQCPQSICHRTLVAGNRGARPFQFLPVFTAVLAVDPYKSPRFRLLHVDCDVTERRHSGSVNAPSLGR